MRIRHILRLQPCCNENTPDRRAGSNTTLDVDRDRGAKNLRSLVQAGDRVQPLTEFDIDPFKSLRRYSVERGEQGGAQCVRYHRWRKLETSRGGAAEIVNRPSMISLSRACTSRSVRSARLAVLPKLLSENS